MVFFESREGMLTSDLAKGAFIKDVRPTPPRGSENPDKTGRGGGRGG